MNAQLTPYNPQGDLVAFDQIAPLPLHLSGAKASNRADGDCRIAADNDLAAINSWLKVKANNPKTYQAYKKELERLVLWAVIERGKAFSALNTDDCQAYLDFLKTLHPDNTRWVALQPTNKSHGHWKPFQYRPTKTHSAVSVLSARSINYANTVISACMDWLVKQNYLKYNSFSDIAPIKSAASGMQANQRLFTRQHIQLMQDYAHSLLNPEAADYLAHLRVAFILNFAFSTGLRLHELAAAKYGDIEHLQDESGSHYFVRVVGKNTRLRKTSLPQTLVDVMGNYRIALGLPPGIRQVAADEPIINSLRKIAGHSLSSAALHKILSGFFKRWLAHLQASQPNDSQLIYKVQQASAHWLRHSYGSFLANDCQVPLAYIRDELGHASIATTSIYLNTDDKKRQRAVSAAFGNNSSNDG